jgi:hypothetical protein
LRPWGILVVGWGLVGCLSRNPAWDDPHASAGSSGGGSGPDAPTRVDFEFGASSYVAAVASLSWPAARAHCLDTYGGDLVVIDDAAELDQLLLNLGGLQGRFYIGLSDIVAEGDFVWVDGTRPTIEYWGPGEPNDAEDGEDCVEMRSSYALQWNDVECSAEHGYVCEWQPATPDTSDGSTSDGSTSDGSTSDGSTSDTEAPPSTTGPAD